MKADTHEKGWDEAEKRQDTHPLNLRAEKMAATSQMPRSILVTRAINFEGCRRALSVSDAMRMVVL
jgi:hypothetical protein